MASVENSTASAATTATATATAPVTVTPTATTDSTNTTSADSTTAATTTDSTDSTSNTPTTTTTTTGRKLYVGNIEYQTTKADVKNLFKDYDVSEIEIPMPKVRHRGGNSGSKTRGYVFVEFGDSVDLDSVINKFTDTEFKGRQIYLRYPKVKDDSSSEDKKPKTKATTTATTTKSTEKSGKLAEKSSEKTSEKSENAAEKSVESGENSTPKESKSFKNKYKPRDKAALVQGEKSKDTLFIRHLDYGLKSKDIQEFFENEGESVQSIHVPLSFIPRSRKIQAQGVVKSKKNKGFAFAKLNLKEGETIDDKVTKFNKKSLKDRELLVTVAIDVKNPHLEKENSEKVNAESTEAEATPAAATSTAAGEAVVTEATTGEQANAKAE